MALLSFAPVTAGPLEDAVAAYVRGDNETAVRLLRPLAEQGGLGDRLLGTQQVLAGHRFEGFAGTTLPCRVASVQDRKCRAVDGPGAEIISVRDSLPSRHRMRRELPSRRSHRGRDRDRVVQKVASPTAPAKKTMLGSSPIQSPPLPARALYLSELEMLRASARARILHRLEARRDQKDNRAAAVKACVRAWCCHYGGFLLCCISRRLRRR
jgi:hypothetical protein